MKNEHIIQYIYKYLKFLIVISQVQPEKRTSGVFVKAMMTLLMFDQNQNTHQVSYNMNLT